MRRRIELAGTSCCVAAETGERYVLELVKAGRIRARDGGDGRLMITPAAVARAALEEAALGAARRRGRTDAARRRCAAGDGAAL
jgi:hypothetical protein